MGIMDVTEGAKLCNLQENRSEWDDYVLDHPQGTVFHLSHWQDMVQSTYGYQPRHLIYRNQTGGLGGLLPLSLVRSRIFGRMLISTPLAAYGGILADSPPAQNTLLFKAQEIAREEGVQFLELRNAHAPLEHASLLNKDLYVTFRQELFEDPEQNFLKIPRKTRAECREGIRNGLEFKADEIGVDGFYGIYSRNVRDLGTPVFPKRLFSNGLRLFGDKCRIFSVHHEGKPVASVWTLFFRDEIIPYYGASLREFNGLGVNNFMYWMLIQYGCENGYKVFDFGRSKKGSGSFNFKKRWGQTMTALSYQYYLVRRNSLPDTSPLNPRFSLSIEIWKRLPLPLANAIGPIITKHLV